MTLNDRINRNTPNSTPALSTRAVEVMHKYQEVGRDIEMLRDFLARPFSMAGIDLRIAACSLSVSILMQELQRMQIAALNEGKIL